MRTSGPDAEQEQQHSDYHEMRYVHSNGDTTVYDLQEIRQEGRTPQYILSESPKNEGPGFDDANTRHVVAHDAAKSAITLNNPEVFPDAKKEIRPEEVQLYQQRPDGDFDKVHFQKDTYGGPSSVDTEMDQTKQFDPKSYAEYAEYKAGQESSPSAPLEFHETTRSLHSREDVQEQVGDTPMHAPEETNQQQDTREYESLNAQWKDLSGPEIDRPAEVAVDQAQQAAQAQRAQEQAQQMGQHQQEHQHSQEM